VLWDETSLMPKSPPYFAADGELSLAPGAQARSQRHAEYQGGWDAKIKGAGSAGSALSKPDFVLQLFHSQQRLTAISRFTNNKE
jgi:hypothetical protein